MATAPADGPKKSSFWATAAKDFLSGGVSGAFGALTFQPLDVIKTRMQKLKPADGSSSGAQKTGRALGANTFTIGQQIVKQDGLQGLWRGTGPTLYRVVPGYGLYFMTMQAMTNVLTTPENPKLSPLQSAAVGVMSRSAVTLLLSPFSVIKTRFEAGDVQYRGTFHAMRTIYTTEGHRALFSGLVPTILRDAPFAGIQLLSYNEFKELAKPLVGTSFVGIVLNDTVVNMTAGFVAGFMATAVTHPFDVLKTRMQLEHSQERSGVWQLTKTTFQNEGVFGLYRGFGPRILRRALHSAVIWAVYEEGAKLMKKLTGS